MSEYFALQRGIFEAATAASKQIERQRTLNRARIRSIEKVPREIGKAENELNKALRQVGRYRDDIRSVSQWASSRRVLEFSWLLPRGPRELLGRLWPAFQVVDSRVRRLRDDLRSMKTTSTRLIGFLQSPSFKYGGRPVVDSCADYRAFKRHYDSALVGLDRTRAGLVDMQSRLGFYGTGQGKAFRDQLGTALRVFSDDINAIADTVNQIRNSNALVTACAAFPEKLWDLIFKSVSGRRNKAQFKAHYQDLRLSQQKNLVKQGLANFRDQLREAARGADTARTELIAAFRGLGKHMAGQRGPSSPAVEGYKGLTAAIVTVDGIRASIASVPSVPAASAIQCQAGSGYAGYGSVTKEREPFPWLTVGALSVAAVIAFNTFNRAS